MNDQAMEDTRNKILEVLDMLNRDHRKNCEPWLQKLAEIEAMRSPDTVIYNIDKFRREYLLHPVILD